MKKQLFVFMTLILLLATNASLAQAQQEEILLQPNIEMVADNTRVELTPPQYIQAAQEIEKSSKDKPKKERKLLKKIADKFRKFGKSNFVKKTGRALGKGSTAIAVETSRPFVQAVSFLRGFFEKESKSADYEKVLFFFLENEKELATVYEDATTFEDLTSKIEDKVSEIIENKMLALLRGFLNDFNIEMQGIDQINSISDLEDFFAQQDNTAILQAISSENAKEIFDNNVAAQNLDKYLEGITEDQINEFIMDGGDLSILIDFEKLIDEEKRNIFIESSAALLSQMIVPAMVVSTVSSALSSTVGTVLLVADVGAIISMSVCSGEKTQAKLDSDKALAQFCSYVLYKSAHKVLKSKAKGFLAGKKLKRQYLGHIAHLKDRKAKIKACIADGETRKECRKKVKKEKQLEIIDCVNEKLENKSSSSVRKIRRECRRERREKLRLQLQ